MQCCACIRAGRGLYFDTHDPDGYIKDSQFELLDGGTGIRYSGGHPLPRDAASQTSYELPYPATVRPFAGGWFEAAAIYRTWAGGAALGGRIGPPDSVGGAPGDRRHHPVGMEPRHGGRYQVQGFRGLITAITARCPGFPLSTESCAEMFLDLLDAAIMLEPSAERLGWWDVQGHGEVVPLFRAIYADGFRLFGNYAIIDGVPPFDPLWPASGRRATERDWQALCPDQFFVEIARNVVWGLQPTVACLRLGHLQNPKYAREVEFLKQAARFYHARREFLLRGRMAPPGELETPTLTVTYLRRMIFTKEGEERLVESRLPAVLHSVWEAQDMTVTRLSPGVTGGAECGKVNLSSR